MRLRTLCFALVVIIATFLIRASAQSLSGGMNQVGFHNHYGHSIQPESFTIKANVDFGGTGSYIRQINLRLYPVGSWIPRPDMSFQWNNVSSLVDEFTIYDLPDNPPYGYTINLSYVDLDGNVILSTYHEQGNTNEIMGVQTLPHPNLCPLPYNEGALPSLALPIQGNRYNESNTLYESILHFQIWNADAGWYPSENTAEIESAGSTQMTHTFHKVLLFGGHYCFNSWITYSDRNPYTPDFTDVVIDPMTDHCFDWGVSTGITSADPSQDVISMQNGRIMIKERGLVAISDLSGQQVAIGQETNGFDTSAWAAGVYTVTVIGVDSQVYTRKFSIVH